MTKIIQTIVLLLSLLPLVANANDNVIKDDINTKVTQLAAMMGDSYSHEYADYRGLEILKNKDEILAAVAVFTIEGLGGGNNYTQFMAVFAALDEESESHPKRLSLLDVMVVGGKGLRNIEVKQMKLKTAKGNIIIVVPTAEYGPKDAMCCPSIKAGAQFSFHPSVGGRLKEITKKARK